MAVAVAMAVELLHFQPESGRTTEMFTALCNAARAHRVQVMPTSVYRGNTPWLMLWGPGAPQRAAVMAKHQSAGGHSLVWDLAYWDRDRKVRVSVDAPHPSAWVMRRDLPRARFLADRVPVSDQWRPDGPVLIAGLGDKARVQYGADTVDQWEAEMMRACETRWPDRPVRYRAKKAGVLQPIDQALQGVSLLVTWHSNAAVDAIRMGIPAICKDGAASAVCPSVLGATDPQPLPVDVRDRFLGNLAWFQWAPHEAGQCWRFLQGLA